MLKQGIKVVLLCLVASVPAHADELTDAAQTLCEKVKSCALAQMEGQDITPQVRQMMQPMLDGMCAQVQGKMGEVPVGHELYKPAVACMQSMNTITCEMMQDGEDVVTPACEAFEKLAREAGVDQ